VPQPTPDPRASGSARSRRLGGVAVLFACLLIVYLPLEPALLAPLEGLSNAVPRLAADVIILALAGLALLLDREMPRGPRAVLLGVGAAGAALAVLNAARGFSPVDTIDALRVLVRYPILGALVWRAVGLEPHHARFVIVAVVVSGSLQLLAGAADIAARLAVTLGQGLPLTPAALLVIDGTTGGYYPFGLVMGWLALMLLVLARRAPGAALRRAAAVGLGVALVALLLSTSRLSMLGLAAGAVVLALAFRGPGPRRVAALGVAGVALAMVPTVPATTFSVPGDGGTTIFREPGSTALSLDATQNFRLFLSLDVTPWAAGQEPLLGFGPYQNEAADADPRVRDHVERAGVDWDDARDLMNDSNYASLVIQFGLPASAAFLVLLALPAWLVWGRSRWSSRPIAEFAVANVAATTVGAALGPGFEIRTASIVLWIALFAALGATRR